MDYEQLPAPELLQSILLDSFRYNEAYRLTLLAIQAAQIASSEQQAYLYNEID